MPRAKKTENGKAAPKKAGGKHALAKPLPVGTKLKDFKNTEWILGPAIGQGGFGLIYATRRSSDIEERHVVKIEPLSNGPLFCEIHFYRNIKLDGIPEWMKKKGLKCLGIPKDVVSGTHNIGATSYRFLVMERYGEDLQSIFERQNRQFSPLTAVTVGLKVIDVFEFIHGMGYVHADIKAANILRGLPPDDGEVFVVDFGLVYRFLRDGKRVPYREDPKRRHDGTLEFCSRDAHKGVSATPRSDFETLAFCMLQWMGGHLPWDSLLGPSERDKNSVAAKKEEMMLNIPMLASRCNAAGMPDFVNFLKAVAQLSYDEEINYDHMKGFLQRCVRNLGGNLKDLKVSFEKAGKQANTSAKGKTTRKKPLGGGDTRPKTPASSPRAQTSPRAQKVPLPPAASPRAQKVPRRPAASPRAQSAPRRPTSASKAPKVSPKRAAPSPLASSCSPAPQAKRNRLSNSPVRRTVRSPRETASQTSPSLLAAHKLQRRRQKNLQN